MPLFHNQVSAVRREAISPNYWLLMYHTVKGTLGDRSPSTTT